MRNSRSSTVPIEAPRIFAMKNFIAEIEKKVLEGEGITLAEARELLETGPLELIDLLAVANRVRQQFFGDAIDLCSIMNAKSGRCPEDCKFCAQSAHYDGVAESYPMRSVEEMVGAAKDAERKGVHRFSIVTSGKRVNKKDFAEVLEAVRLIRKDTRLHQCCSLGMLSAEQARALSGAGVERYHHNLETSESFFGHICTTHSYADKLRTLTFVRKAGMEICSGGIIGLGESPIQWMEMIFFLRDWGVESIPVNILNPRPGTPLGNVASRSPLEVLKIIAVMRLSVPRIPIRIAGGREVSLRDLQAATMWAGASGLMVGGYLTTGGRPVEADYQMLEDLGLRREPHAQRSCVARGEGTKKRHGVH
jgi:biotin synthase